MKPHKHAELIKAWADGAEIQVLPDTIDGTFWKDVEKPQWDDCQIYRIKPKEPVVRWLWTYLDYGQWTVHTRLMTEKEACVAFTGLPYQKLEWSRQEFDE